jgi:hypothetical protein
MRAALTAVSRLDSRLFPIEPMAERDPPGHALVADFSIMPGDGGWGIITSFQGFKTFGRFVAFASGSYLFSPQEQNDYLRRPDRPVTDPTSAYYTIGDQYAARIGVGTSVERIGLSLAARLEGVPSEDIIGGSNGRRRPAVQCSP